MRLRVRTCLLWRKSHSGGSKAHPQNVFGRRTHHAFKLWKNSWKWNGNIISKLIIRLERDNHCIELTEVSLSSFYNSSTSSCFFKCLWRFRCREAAVWDVIMCQGLGRNAHFWRSTFATSTLYYIWAQSSDHNFLRRRFCPWSWRSCVVACAPPMIIIKVWDQEINPIGSYQRLTINSLLRLTSSLFCSFTTYWYWCQSISHY